MNSLVGFGDASFDGAVQGILEATEEAFLLDGDFLREFGMGGIDEGASFFTRTLEFGVETFQILAGVALDFVDESGGGGFGGFGEKGAGAIEGFADNVGDLGLGVGDEVAAGLIEFTGKFAGDVDFERVKEVAGWITPNPGGTGPMTVLGLMQNLIDAARYQAGLERAGYSI